MKLRRRPSLPARRSPLPPATTPSCRKRWPRPSGAATPSAGPTPAPMCYLSSTLNGAPTMSLILRMLSKRSAAIAQSFGARASSYEENADLQRTVAKRLARLLPPLSAPRVLELGCGTGLFSRHLLAGYPNGALPLTHLPPPLASQCRRNLAGPAKQASFQLLPPPLRHPADPST